MYSRTIQLTERKMTGTKQVSGEDLIFQWHHHFVQGNEAAMRAIFLKLYSTDKVLDKKYLELKNKIDLEIQKKANDYVCIDHSVKTSEPRRIQDERERQAQEIMRVIRVPKKINIKQETHFNKIVF